MLRYVKGSWKLHSTFEKGVDAAREETASPEVGVSILIFSFSFAFLKYGLWVGGEWCLRSSERTLLIKRHEAMPVASGPFARLGKSLLQHFRNIFRSNLCLSHYLQALGKLVFSLRWYCSIPSSLGKPPHMRMLNPHAGFRYANGKQFQKQNSIKVP
jgi:hypothetical protein